MANQPLNGSTPGRTQLSFGRSRYANPRSDFQSGPQTLPWEVAEDHKDHVRDYHASLRSDPTNSEENLGLMLYVNGNPDLYGPDQPIVQEKAVKPAGRYKQPVPRTGVTRQQ
jgi:hypothetical protein